MNKRGQKLVQGPLWKNLHEFCVGFFMFFCPFRAVFLAGVSNCFCFQKISNNPGSEKRPEVVLQLKSFSWVTFAPRERKAEKCLEIVSHQFCGPKESPIPTSWKCGFGVQCGFFARLCCRSIYELGDRKILSENLKYMSNEKRAPGCLGLYRG